MKKFFKCLLSFAILLTMISTEISPCFTSFRTNASAVSYSVGDIIEFGSYPQSLVTDESLISILNNRTRVWKSYNYYTGRDKGGTMTASDYMKYADVTQGNEKYRLVVFHQNRPTRTWYKDDPSNSYQDENGYSIDTFYWFKYEPIKWIVLDPDEGLLITKNILDSQAFSNTIYFGDYYAYGDSAETYQAVNYSKSTIRQWLRYDFYNTAFSGSEPSIIKKDGYVSSGSSSYSDSVFLLSADDIGNSNYGFDSDKSVADYNRLAYGTDYAKIQGLYVSDDIGSSGYSKWRLRDHSTQTSYSTCIVDCDGTFSIEGGDVEGTEIGVRPCIKIDFETFNSDPVTDDDPQKPPEPPTEVIVDTIIDVDQDIRENPLVKRVSQYCYPFDTVSFQNDLNNKWNLNNVSEFNEFADRYNSLSVSLKERYDLMWIAGGIDGINANEIYCAWNFKEYLSNLGVRLVMGLSGLTFNGEAVGYLVGEWAEKEKYKDALEKFIGTTNEDFKEIIYMKETLSLLESISEAAGSVPMSKKINTLSHNLSACISKMEFDNILYSFDFESNGITVPKINHKSLPLAEAFGFAGDTIEIVDITSQGIANLITVASEVEIYKYYQDFLTEIMDDTSLPCALRKAAQELNQDLDAQYIRVIAEVGQDINKMAAESVISLSVENLGSAALSATLSSVLAGISIGKFIGNIFFGVDEIVKACAYIECYAILGEKYAGIVLADKELFNNNVTLENAIKFREDYEILWALRKLGEETYLEMSGCDNLYSSTIRNALRNMSNYEEKREYATFNINKLQNCRFTMKDDIQSGMIEHREIYYERIVIGCPVDIMVYDIGDNLVGKTENNIVDDSVVDNSQYPVCIYVDNEIKTIKLSDLSNYRIEIVAFDSGTMNYTATTVNGDGLPVKKTNIYDISLSAGDTFTINPFNSSEDDYQDLYKRPNDYDLEWIAPSEQFDEGNMNSAYVDITVSISGDGEVIKPEKITYGDCVTLIAAGNGTEFSGWQENGETISQGDTLTFIATQNRDLTAVFGEYIDTESDADDSDTSEEFSEFEPGGLSVFGKITIAVVALVFVAGISAIIIVTVRRRKSK